MFETVLTLQKSSVKTSSENVFHVVRFHIQNTQETPNCGREAPQTRACPSRYRPRRAPAQREPLARWQHKSTSLLARRPAMVAAAFASTSASAAAAYSSSLPPNPTARDPFRRRTPPLVTATNRHRHVHGRTATSLRQVRPRDQFVNPPRPQFPAAAAAAAEAGEMAAEASTAAKPFAVLFVCLGKSREPLGQSPPLSGRPYQLIRVASYLRADLQIQLTSSGPFRMLCAGCPVLLPQPAGGSIPFRGGIWSRRFCSGASLINSFTERSR
jgi:hypothetical protein